jgi:hypothetical protein
LKPFKWYSVFLLAALAAFAAAWALHSQLVRKQSNYGKLRARAEQRLQAEERRINDFLDRVDQNFRHSPDFTLAHLRYLHTLTESIEGRLFNGESAKKAELDDAALPRIEVRQAFECLVQRQ